MDFMKEREKAQNSLVVGPHNTLAFDANGEEIKQFTLYQTYCYAHITYVSDVPCEYLFTFFGKDTYFDPDRICSWANWVINKSFYKDAFITKDVEEGLKYGFQINTHVDRATMQGGMFALRHIFEFRKFWSWSDFINRGYDEYQSYALATHIYISGSNIYNNPSNFNHFVMQKWSAFDTYLGKYKSNNEKYNKPLCEGFNGIPNFSPTMWGCKEKYNLEDKYDKIGLTTKFTKENCDKLINYLKGIA